MNDLRLYRLTFNNDRREWCVAARNKAEAVRSVSGLGDDVSDPREFTVTRVLMAEPVTQWQDEEGTVVITRPAREWLKELAERGGDCVYCPPL